MKGIKAVALLIGAISVSEVNSLANNEIEQKLSKILARNDLLIKKQTLLKSLDTIDEQLDQATNMADAAAGATDGVAEQPPSDQAKGVIDDSVTVEAGAAGVDAAAKTAVKQQDKVIAEVNTAIKADTKVLEADKKAEAKAPDAEKQVAADLVKADTSVVASQQAVVDQVTQEKKDIAAALASEKINVEQKDKQALETSKAELNKTAGLAAVEVSALKVEAQKAKVVQAEVVEEKAQIQLDETKAADPVVDKDVKAATKVDDDARANVDVEKQKLDTVKAQAAADAKFVNGDSASGKTGLIVSLFIGLCGGLGIGLYIYNKKTKEIEEGGKDDLYTKFIDEELSN